MSRPPTLPDPVVVDRFFKNRRRSDVIVTTLSTYQDKNIVDVRQYFTNDKGQLRPTSKGVAMGIGRLVELHAALAKALAKARSLGLLDDESGSVE
jgi:Transcriptional Coactivator p15 (PC4)